MGKLEDYYNKCDDRIKKTILEFEEEQFLDDLDIPDSKKKAFVEYNIKKFLTRKLYEIINEKAINNVPYI